MAFFRKDSPKFDGENYLNWKNRMMTHLQCIAFEVAIKEVEISSLEDLAKDDATSKQNNLFHQNAIAKESLINALSNSEILEIKKVDTTYKIWKHLEDMFEGD